VSEPTSPEIIRLLTNCIEPNVMRPTANTPRASRRVRPSVEVIAHDRAHDAHQLHLGGLDWSEIAARTGYADRRLARLAVNAYLQKVALERGPEHRRDALQTELDRLDVLQAAVWDRAVTGEPQAIGLALKIIARRCSVLGLDHPDISSMSRPVSIVIGGTSDEYIAGLKAITADSHADRREQPADEMGPAAVRSAASTDLDLVVCR
jgi:hypothetical protein